MNTNVTGAALVNRGFSDVDGSGQADEHAAYLDRAARSVAAARERWLERLELGPGDVVLDAGCGLGEVARHLVSQVGPRGRVVDSELSAELVERAQARGGGVNNDPQAALAELLRVLRPGARTPEASSPGVDR